MPELTDFQRGVVFILNALLDAARTQGLEAEEENLLHALQAYHGSRIR